MWWLAAHRDYFCFPSLWMFVSSVFDLTRIWSCRICGDFKDIQFRVLRPAWHLNPLGFGGATRKVASLCGLVLKKEVCINSCPGVNSV